MGPSAPGGGTVIAARCLANPTRSPEVVSRRPSESRLFVDSGLSICDLLVGGVNVKSPLKQIASLKSLLGGR